MTAQAPALSVEAIDAALAAATPGLDDGGRGLAAAVIRLLAAGEPVSVLAAAAAAGVPATRAGPLLRSWPGVFWDDRGQVTGFWGLALAPMPHRIRRGTTDLHAWCAFDPLFLSLVIGGLQVTTADPVTSETIAYRIGEDGTISGASHPHAVLSFLRPSQPWDDDVMTTFCHYVWHFTSPATARRWTAAHLGTFVLSLSDATELARRHAARAFGVTSA
jgi:hypothetical protein